MKTPRLFSNIILFDEIDSTNNYVKQNVQQLANHSVVRTHFQTNGRGQFERKWQSNKGDNLLFTILFKEQQTPITEVINPVIVGALISTLKEYKIEATYKSPNDIYVNNKKIAGILIETKYDQNRLQYMVVGIGLNINQQQFEGLNATSMANELNQTCKTDDVLNQLLSNIENNLLLVQLIKEDENGH